MSEAVEIIARALKDVRLVVGVEGGNEINRNALAQAALKALEDANYLLVKQMTEAELVAALDALTATPTPSRTEEGDGG